MKSLRLTGAAVAAMLAFGASSAEAQFYRTGEQTLANGIGGCNFGLGCDAKWTVQWFGLSGGYGSSGGPVQAAIISNPPSSGGVGGPWAPNIPGVQQWIGASNSATLSPNTGNSNSNYRYYFQTTFTQTVNTTLDFGIGWDNKLVGAWVGGSINGDGTFNSAGATALIAGISPGSPYMGGDSGFCRDADGVFPTAQHPNCVLNLSLAVSANQQQTLTFVVEGDGTTDGFLAGTSTRVPEPTSLALLSAGLVGLVSVGRRRRA